MINLEELTEKDIGRWVYYKTDHGTIERGRIKSWNDNWVFVVYKCGNDWSNFQNYTGCATSPEDLHFDCPNRYRALTGLNHIRDCSICNKLLTFTLC